MAIDHESRRKRIAEMTIDIIADEGLSAATIRRIAAEGGFSTAAITYYFTDKRELVLAAFHALSQIGEVEFAEALARNPGDLTDALMTMVAWCPANFRRWRAYLAFWDQAARDEQIAAELRQSTITGLELIAHGVKVAYPSNTDPEATAGFLNSVIQGISLQSLVSPKDWSETRIRLMLTQALEMRQPDPK